MNARSVLLLLFLSGCAGTMRDCSSWNAESFGADWIIVTNGADGRVVNCWQLKGVSVGNEPHSDGIWWKSPAGHLVHLSGWYTRTQVQGGDFGGAAKEIGVDLTACPGGQYRTVQTAALPVTNTSPTVTALPTADASPPTGENVLDKTFDGGHRVRVVFKTDSVGKLRVDRVAVDDRSVDPQSQVGQAALCAAVGGE